MITIKNSIVKKHPKFWNNCVLHPTDAVEDGNPIKLSFSANSTYFVEVK